MKCTIQIPSEKNTINHHVDKIRKRIESIRQEIIHHPVYDQIKTIDDLNVFMKYHIYAVWDFMSLLKALQQNLTCTTLPWFPKGSAETRFLINEIVVGEESDLDLNGKRKSHFELYRDAMNQSGADTSAMNTFIAELKRGSDMNTAFSRAKTPDAAKAFVKYTFDIIHTQKDYLQAGVFTFGREDLIPSMFMSIIQDLDLRFPHQISIFKYYLERHIEVDGDHHSHLAIQMTEQLCEQNALYWQELEEAVVKSLEMRKMLWDGIYQEIKEQKISEGF